MGVDRRSRALPARVAAAGRAGGRAAAGRVGDRHRRDAGGVGGHGAAGARSAAATAAAGRDVQRAAATTATEDAHRHPRRRRRHHSCCRDSRHCRPDRSRRWRRRSVYRPRRPWSSRRFRRLRLRCPRRGRRSGRLRRRARPTPNLRSHRHRRRPAGARRAKPVGCGRSAARPRRRRLRHRPSRRILRPKLRTAAVEAPLAAATAGPVFTVAADLDEHDLAWTDRQVGGDPGTQTSGRSVAGPFPPRPPTATTWMEVTPAGTGTSARCRSGRR